MAFVEQASGWWPSFTEVGAKGAEEALVGDGYLGCAEHAPYDGVLVTAAVTEIPPPLIAQLRVGGRMVVPVGRSFASQDLTVLEKRHAGQPKTQSVLPVAFVPFKRESGNEGKR